MNPFTFYNPVKIHFGDNAIDKLPKELDEYGKNVLIVYGGGSIKKNGVYNDVISVLELAGKKVFEVDGVEPNPRVETARRGAEICKKENIDFVLAVGGGSVIDCAKLIVAAAKYDGDAWDIVTKKVIATNALPLGTVLTLAATGSEMNSGSVITNAETLEKFSWGSPAVFPKFSILNPAYTLSVPRNHTVYGIVDMMSHIFEQYFHNATNTPVTDEMCEGVLRAVMAAATKLVENLDDIALRETVLIAGTIGLNGFLSIGSRGDWATHNIEHAVSAVYDIPHAGGLAILQPHWMRLAVQVNPERFAGLATRVFAVDSLGKTVEQVAYEGIDRLSAFWSSLGAPTRLADYDIDDSKFNQIVEHAMANGPFGNFKKLEQQDVRTILENAL
ncbi:iron-containing alcohol dehydrogenase [Solibacillus sp. CAU 1738]|uniref:iron-containing alcohol dehydrogenase n=1 Tax=Solibacillus sp. CAU 1738 TaxID=3140363 RepID=UPI0032603664